MSILIKGMTMPIHCSVCKFFDHGDCELLPYGDYIDDKHKRRDNCPLVELPQHGDLIDRDALTTVTEMVNGEFKTYYEKFEIDDAPVLIESEDSNVNSAN